MGEDKPEERLFLSCGCRGCSAIELVRLNSWDDESDNDQVVLSIWEPCFYSYQGGLFSGILRRIRIALKVIFKGEYFLHDIILEKEDLDKLRDYINKFYEDQI